MDDLLNLFVATTMMLMLPPFFARFLGVRAYSWVLRWKIRIVRGTFGYPFIWAGLLLTWLGREIRG